MIYSRGGAEQIYIKEDMGGTWEVGDADLRRFHRADTLRDPQTKALHTMDIRPHIKLKTML